MRQYRGQEGAGNVVLVALVSRVGCFEMVIPARDHGGARAAARRL